MQFQNRLDAGRRLVERLAHYRNHPQAIVLALPRGGVPVGWEVCRVLNIPLDIFVVRKIGVPGHEETAMGAIASGGVRVFNKDVIRTLGIRDEAIAAAAAVAQVELERRETLYRGERFLPDLNGRIVILVDDGMATGASMTAAVQAIKAFNLQRLVVAVPVASPEACALLGQAVDEIVCVDTPENFKAVGWWYQDFSQTSDDEVRMYLNPSHGCVLGVETMADSC
ncbi:MAG: phosphoribosyl transferase [Desulfatitalea sp. BRH_c12]|nr:MAG: phosphoribosyl transferase [Desulfatitalea sp. BRH_c12]